DFTAAKRHALKRREVCRNDAQRPGQIAETGLSDGPHEAVFHGKTAQKALARGEDRINQTPEGPAAFQLPRKFLEGTAVMPVGPERPHVGAHTGARDGIYFDSVFFENLNDANVGEALGGSGGKRQAHHAARYLAGDPPDVGAKRTARVR